MSSGSRKHVKWICLKFERSKINACRLNVQRSCINLSVSFLSGSRHSSSSRLYNRRIWLSCAVAVTNELIDA
jgi:hypothetical protein